MSEVNVFGSGFDRQIASIAITKSDCLLAGSNDPPENHSRIIHPLPRYWHISGSGKVGYQTPTLRGVVEFWMGDVIKLRQARKVAERLRRGKRAALNGVLRGHSKAERNLEAARKAKTQRDLDQHRLDNGDER